jgi:hypothetical protein
MADNSDAKMEYEVPEDQVIDLEEHAKAGKKPPKAKKYKIKIDKEKYEVQVPCMTGRQILALASKNPPERFQLNQKLHGGQVLPIGLDQTVDFTTPGIEKFMTVPLDQTEG